MKHAITNPRDIAVDALCDKAGNVSAHLERLLEEANISVADKAFARELALGVVRRQGTLRAVLRAHLHSPQQKLPGAVEQIMQVALYQMLFLDRVPDFAAVNEAVEQTSRYRHNRKSGVVNGVLRTVQRSIEGTINELPRPAGDVIPIATDHGMKLKSPVFPDPVAQPARYLAAACSLPEAMAERWLKNFGSFERAFEVAMQANARAPQILRVNTAHTEPAVLLGRMIGAGIDASLHSNGHSIVLRGYYNVSSLPSYNEGLFQPQDPSATEVVLAIAPKSGMKVLDFCAAPGTKTTHFAELMRNEGEIVATDVNPQKLQRIEDNCRRMGITIVKTRLAQDIGGLELHSFDIVLVDAPCSNTGVLARRAEARWRFEEDRLGQLVRDQQMLLKMAGEFVRRGGRLAYSVCSIEPEEGSGISKWFRNSNPRTKCIMEKFHLPEGLSDVIKWRDGGYYAVFEL